MSMSPRNIPHEAGIEIAKALNAGGEMRKGVISKYTQAPWGWSQSKVYDVAKEYGWQSKRKARADKGVFRKEGFSDEALEQCARVLLATTRYKLGKRLMCTDDLIQQMVLNGYKEFEGVPASTLNRWLREHQLNHAQLLSTGAAIEMRSLHPNHIHFVDASICVQWDFNGKKKMVARDMKTAFYKNKPGYWKEVRKVLIRWVIVDDCSGAFYVDYSYAGGENTADLLNFILDAWGQKSYSSKYPFHGVPKMLGMDPGAANTSHEVGALIKKLGVEPYVHAPGNSRASGVVEVIHGFWERRFEWELLLKLAENLEELRTRAHDKMTYLNAMAEHSRTKVTRNLKWLEIKQEQLKILPPKDYCQKLATSKPVKRTPDERLRISFEGREYQLHAPALKKVAVWADRNPWQVNELNVWVEGGEMVPCRLIEKDAHGFDTQAPVYGEGIYKSHADTPAQTLVKSMEKSKAGYVVEGFEPKPTAHLVPDQTFMPKRGTPIVRDELPKEPPVKAGDVAGRIRIALDIERITAPMRQQLDGWLNDRDVLSAEEYRSVLEIAKNRWCKDKRSKSANVANLYAVGSGE